MQEHNVEQKKGIAKDVKSEMDMLWTSWSKTVQIFELDSNTETN